MTLAPPELEERYRRFLNGRGDDIVPLISCLQGDGNEARAESRAWAALILSRIYLLKGRLALAASFLRHSAAAFREQPCSGIPLELWVNRAILLKWDGRIDRAERLLRRVFGLAVRKGDYLAAAGAASSLAHILARSRELREAAVFHGFAHQSYRVMHLDAELAGTDLVGSLIQFESGRCEEAMDNVFTCVRRCEELALEREVLAGLLLLFEMYLSRDDGEGAERCARLIARKELSLARFRLLLLRFLYLKDVHHRKRGEVGAARVVRQNAERLRASLGVAQSGLWRLSDAKAKDIGASNGINGRTPDASPGGVRGDGDTAHEDRLVPGGESGCVSSGGPAESRCMYIVPQTDDNSTYTSKRKGRPTAIFITGNRRMRRILEEVRRAAPFPVPVLIEGESGVGKEIIARMIHDASGRERHQFVPVNAASFPRDLVGSILFGHARGAFTGATARRCGLVEAAGEGTLFLDEIGEIDADTQVQLLRLLDRNEYIPVGESAVKRSKARIITSTNRDLYTAVQSGCFRRDLYHRLCVLSFHIPPLRERRGDIPLLVEHFVRSCCEEYNLGPLSISDAAMHVLAEYEWPGNVRELKHEVIRAVVRRRTGVVRVCHLSARIIDPGGERPASTAASLPTRLAELERDEIMRALREESGNRTRAAAALGLRRTTLIHRMKRLGIE